MSEPRITAPQRRYEILDDSETVQNKLVAAFLEREPASLEIKLADVYEGELPIPDEILRRKIGMYVLDLSCSRRTGDIQAFGNTTESQLAAVSVHIPSDHEKPSTLQLLDVTFMRTDK